MRFATGEENHPKEHQSAPVKWTLDVPEEVSKAAEEAEARAAHETAVEEAKAAHEAATSGGEGGARSRRRRRRRERRPRASPSPNFSPNPNFHRRRNRARQLLVSDVAGELDALGEQTVTLHVRFEDPFELDSVLALKVYDSRNFSARTRRRMSRSRRRRTRSSST